MSQQTAKPGCNAPVKELIKVFYRDKEYNVEEVLGIRYKSDVGFIFELRFHVPFDDMEYTDDELNRGPG